MIFVTVGTQGPFDRLIRTIDQWAGRCGADVVAQIGPSRYISKYIKAKPFIHPNEFRKHIEAARVVVAHAGMGSIITALEYGKQIIVMPRRCDLREHRTDHQVATARQFAEQGFVVAAFSETELCTKLDNIESPDITDKLSSCASPALIAAIQAFIEQRT